MFATHPTNETPLFRETFARFPFACLPPSAPRETGRRPFAHNGVQCTGVLQEALRAAGDGCMVEEAFRACRGIRCLISRSRQEGGGSGSY